jgi:acetyl esterase
VTESINTTERLLPGPAGDFRIRIYRPDSTPRGGVIWVHGGGFAGGDLEMPEAHWVSAELARRGASVVSVDYSLAPVPALWAERTGETSSRPGVHFPVASEEVTTTIRWARDSGLSAGPWAVGGASAGANLVAGSVLRMLEAGRDELPSSVLLAYGTFHAIQPPPSDAAVAALATLPREQRFGPEIVRGMYENYLGGAVENAPVGAVPGLASAAMVAGFPPTLLISSEADDLRVSTEAFAATLREAGVPIELTTEPGTQHGHLNRPEEPGAAASLRLMSEFLSRNGIGHVV